MGWRFYAQRPGTGLWLDTNVQLSDIDLTWQLSAPGSATALIPAGLNATPLAEDGEQMWGKGNTLLFAEEDGDLAWSGFCTAANPSDSGLDLEFVGSSGWLQGVPFNTSYASWRVNVFNVVRTLLAHSRLYKPGFDFQTHSRNSRFLVGDPKPPAKPRQPYRRKGESWTEFKASSRRTQWIKAVAAWEKAYKDREKFEINWFEGPYVGEELDTLAKEAGFDYRERVKWLDKGDLIPAHYLDFEDDLVTRRSDIQFVDGVNLAAPLDAKDGSETYANRVIALGAGEGRSMARTWVGEDDGRLYQAEYVQYKSIKNLASLRALASADHKALSSTNPKVGTLSVRNIPGFASVSTLRVGDEVEVISDNVAPAVRMWVRVVGITRNPNKDTVAVAVEAAV